MKGGLDIDLVSDQVISHKLMGLNAVNKRGPDLIRGLRAYLHGRLKFDIVLDLVIPEGGGAPVEGSLADVFRAEPRGGIRTEGVRNLELPAAAESEGVLFEGDRVGGARPEVVDVPEAVDDADAPRNERVLWEWLIGSLDDPSEIDRVLVLEGRVRSARLSVLRAKPTGLVGGRAMLVLDFMWRSECDGGIVVVFGAVEASLVVSRERCRSATLEGDFLMGEEVSRVLVFAGENRFSWLIFSGDRSAANSLAGDTGAMFSFVGEPSCGVVCASSSLRPKMLIFRRLAADDTTSLCLAAVPSLFVSASGVLASS